MSHIMRGFALSAILTCAALSAQTPAIPRYQEFTCTLTGESGCEVVLALRSAEDRITDHQITVVGKTGFGGTIEFQLFQGGEFQGVAVVFPKQFPERLLATLGPNEQATYTVKAKVLGIVKLPYDLTVRVWSN